MRRKHEKPSLHESEEWPEDQESTTPPMITQTPHQGSEGELGDIIGDRQQPNLKTGDGMSVMNCKLCQ